MANPTPQTMVYLTKEGKAFDALSGKEISLPLPNSVVPFWGYFLDKDGVEHPITDLFGGGGSGSAFNFMGTVPTYADLPTEAEKGDAYQTEDTKHLWAYNGTEWSDLGEVLINLDNYYTKAQTDVKFDDHTRASDTKYQGKLIPGANITISDTNVIAATAGVLSVLTDGETVLGDGVTIPLSSPQQGSKFTTRDDGTPFPTEAAIPTPYDPLAVYLVEERGTLGAEPDIAQMILGEDDELHRVGETHNELPLVEAKVNDHEARINSLDTEVDGQRTAINNLTQSLSAESSARQAMDTQLRGLINGVSAAVGNETTDRMAQDSVLQGEIEAIQEAGYLVDAPKDGKQYARQNGSWSEVTGGGSGFPDAPVDGKEYVRKDGAWELNARMISKAIIWNGNQVSIEVLFKGDTQTEIFGRRSDDYTGRAMITAVYVESMNYTKYSSNTTTLNPTIIIEFATSSTFDETTMIWSETSPEPSDPLADFKLTKWVQKETGDGSKTNFPLTQGTAMFVQGVRIKHTDDSISILWQEDDYVLESDNSITLTAALGNGDVVGFEYVGRA